MQYYYTDSNGLDNPVITLVTDKNSVCTHWRKRAIFFDRLNEITVKRECSPCAQILLRLMLQNGADICDFRGNGLLTENLPASLANSGQALFKAYMSRTEKLSSELMEIGRLDKGNAGQTQQVLGNYIADVRALISAPPFAHLLMEEKDRWFAKKVMELHRDKLKVLAEDCKFDVAKRNREVRHWDGKIKNYIQDAGLEKYFTKDNFEPTTLNETGKNLIISLGYDLIPGQLARVWEFNTLHDKLVASLTAVKKLLEKPDSSHFYFSSKELTLMPHVVPVKCQYVDPTPVHALSEDTEINEDDAVLLLQEKFKAVRLKYGKGHANAGETVVLVAEAASLKIINDRKAVPTHEII